MTSNKIRPNPENKVNLRSNSGNTATPMCKLLRRSDVSWLDILLSLIMVFITGIAVGGLFVASIFRSLGWGGLIIHF